MELPFVFCCNKASSTVLRLIDLALQDGIFLVSRDIMTPSCISLFSRQHRKITSADVKLMKHDNKM